jgi:hypothetical protein
MIPASFQLKKWKRPSRKQAPTEVEQNKRHHNSKTMQKDLHGFIVRNRY